MKPFKPHRRLRASIDEAFTDDSDVPSDPEGVQSKAHARQLNHLYKFPQWIPKSQAAPEVLRQTTDTTWHNLKKRRKTNGQSGPVSSRHQKSQCWGFQFSNGREVNLCHKNLDSPRTTAQNETPCHTLPVEQSFAPAQTDLIEVLISDAGYDPPALNSAIVQEPSTPPKFFRPGAGAAHFKCFDKFQPCPQPAQAEDDDLCLVACEISCNHKKSTDLSRRGMQVPDGNEKQKRWKCLLPIGRDIHPPSMTSGLADHHTDNVVRNSISANIQSVTNKAMSNRNLCFVDLECDFRSDATTPSRRCAAEIRAVQSPAKDGSALRNLAKFTQPCRQKEQIRIKDARKKSIASRKQGFATFSATKPANKSDLVLPASTISKSFARPKLRKQRARVMANPRNVVSTPGFKRMRGCKAPIGDQSFLVALRRPQSGMVAVESRGKTRISEEIRPVDRGIAVRARTRAMIARVLREVCVARAIGPNPCTEGSNAGAIALESAVHRLGRPRYRTDVRNLIAAIRRGLQAGGQAQQLLLRVLEGDSNAAEEFVALPAVALLTPAEVESRALVIRAAISAATVRAEAGNISTLIEELACPDCGETGPDIQLAPRMTQLHRCCPHADQRYISGAMYGYGSNNGQRFTATCKKCDHSWKHSEGNWHVSGDMDYWT